MVKTEIVATLNGNVFCYDPISFYYYNKAHLSPSLQINDSKCAQNHSNSFKYILALTALCGIYGYADCYFTLCKHSVYTWAPLLIIIASTWFDAKHNIAASWLYYCHRIMCRNVCMVGCECECECDNMFIHTLCKYTHSKFRLELRNIPDTMIVGQISRMKVVWRLLRTEHQDPNHSQNATECVCISSRGRTHTLHESKAHRTGFVIWQSHFWGKELSNNFQQTPQIHIRSVLNCIVVLNIIGLYANYSILRIYLGEVRGKFARPSYHASS